MDKPTTNAALKGSSDLVERTLTGASVTIPIEVFEKRYLTPQAPPKGGLYKKLGNPTPLALLGFLMAAHPLACTLLGWRGASGNGIATIGFTYFFGGLLQLIGALLEFFIGNTFPFVVFGSFGAFWLAFGATQTPSFNAEAYFTSGAKTAAEEAAALKGFYASFAFGLLFLGLLVLFYTICALRTNVVFFFVFVNLEMALLCLAASYFCLAAGDTAHGANLTTAAASFVFSLCIGGWYLLLTMLLDTVDFPLHLPVGDLSARIKGASGRRKGTDETEEA